MKTDVTRQRALVLAGAVLALAAAASADGAVAWVLSSSGNISCEMANGYAGATNVLCQSIRRPQTVTMGVKGCLRICRGERCLSNAPESVVTLGYGKSRTVGHFRCTSLHVGVRCVVINTGRGSLIDRRAIAPFKRQPPATLESRAAAVRRRDRP